MRILFASIGLAILCKSADSCQVGENVKCPDGNYYCSGNQCCHDGSTCPSAPSTFRSCPKPKSTDCTGTGPSPGPAPSPPAPSSGQCLCVFDIDRTLTGKQGAASSCPGDVVQYGIPDTAYGGGELLLSELANSLAGSFCHECFLGTISAGDASGWNSPERIRLQEKLAAGGDLPTNTWNNHGCTVVESPLVTGCADGNKQNAIPGIKQWYANNKGANIADRDVYFFDDRSINIRGFQGKPYNARQISCGTRDAALGMAVGLCGARLSEMQKVPGVFFCGGREDSEDSLRETQDGIYSNLTSSVVV